MHFEKIVLDQKSLQESLTTGIPACIQHCLIIKRDVLILTLSILTDMKYFLNVERMAIQ